jgi:hypothetical protein
MLNKYLKYKKKYLNLKYKLHGGNNLTPEEEYAFNNSLKLVKDHNLPSQPLSSVHNNNDTVRVIAFKSSTVIDSSNPGFIANIGKNINKKYTMGVSCKENPFDINNPSYCYFFVTLIEDLISQLKNKNIDSELRLKELLGLKKEWGPYTHVLYIDVKKSNLFRPCYDKPDITSDVCPTDSQFNNEYNKWFEHFKHNSEKYDVPFTGLGYTFDWINSTKNNTTDMKGVSEFIIVPGSEVTINSIFTLDDFFTNIGITLQNK